MTISWDPIRNMEALQRKINRVIDDAFSSAKDFSEEAGVSDFKPRVDIYETETAVLVEAELAGLTKESVTIEVKDNLLTIKGQKTPNEMLSALNYYRRERQTGNFNRTFTLPSTIDPENIHATFSNGVLVIEIKKPEQEKAKTINIS